MSRDLDKELQEALARVQPPEGFAGRVAARLPKQHRRTTLNWLIATAAAVLLVFTVRFGQVQHQAQRHADEVQQQVAFALRLTAEKLAVIDGRLKRSAPELQIESTEGEL